MPDTVLIVDDEANIRAALMRLLDDTDVKVLEAGSGEEAVSVLGGQHIAVIVSDSMMPGMGGVKFLARAKVLQPDAARILLTGQADLPTALDAINQGEVFRFLLKPWDDGTLLTAISDGLTHFRTVRFLREGDDSALRSIAQTIELKDPYTRGHCDRVAAFALAIGRGLGLGNEHLREIEQGSWLHDCGKIGVPEAILNFPGPLGAEEIAVVRKHPLWGADVARKARLPRVIVDIVLHHHERWDGKGYPGGLAGGKIPVEARIVAVADTFDAMMSERPYRRGMEIGKAREILSSVAGTQLDPDLVAIFLDRLSTDPGMAAHLAAGSSHG